MTEAQTLTLAEFLLARISEDQAEARAATPGPWATQTMAGNLVYGDPAVGTFVADTGRTSTEQPLDDAKHIERWHPARVLAECDAKRRIVELHRPWVSHPVAHVAEDGTVRDIADESFEAIVGTESGCATCAPIFRRDPCETLLLLALPYADHPDYSDEWRA